MCVLISSQNFILRTSEAHLHSSHTNRQKEKEERKSTLSLSSYNEKTVRSVISRKGARSEAEGRKGGKTFFPLSLSSYNEKTSSIGTCVRRPKFEENKSKNKIYIFFFSPCWYLCKIHLQLCA